MENSSHKIIPTGGKLPNQETENMEVHHHPDLHHNAKKWKEYLLEFIMIFFAVFMGFVAENIRENISDRSKEKDYIASLIEDLKLDTANLHKQIPVMEESIKGLDTLIKQIYLYIKGNANTRIMYYTYHHDCRSVFTLELSQRTISQLKNSGNMRLIHDKNTADIISGMELGFQTLYERTAFYKIRQEDAAAFGLKIFDYGEYQKANTNKDGSINTNDEGFLSINYQPHLNNTDSVYLKEFASRVGYFRNALTIYIDHLSSAIPGAGRSIAYLLRTYHIEND